MKQGNSQENAPHPDPFENVTPTPPQMETSTFTPEQPLGEAGGVAWVDLYGTKTVTDSQGKEVRKLVKISLTSRASTPKQALAELMEAIKEADQKYHLTPYHL